MPIKTIFSCFYILLIPMLMSAQQSNNSGLQYFTNTKLVNQWGEEMRYYDDLLKGKKVVIHAFKGDCNVGCPVIFQLMKGLQNHYGQRIGQDIHLISITIDPSTDKVTNIKEFGRDYNTRRGWYILSGADENVNTILKKIGKYVINFNDHNNIIFMGNESTGLWKKVNGLTSLDQAINVFDTVLNDKG